ncbi:MAG: alpha-L-fucosidase [Phycisphaeraceae bacterium]|nr:alpha-L-fucosidase [Phycisphaeraceae bacterium]
MARQKDPFAWFEQARFGMFIHWGIHALLGRGEQVLFRERLDQSEYERLADRFNPRRFDADAWARAACEAGMKYMVLTTKHHDGYCLFDSALTDYTSAKRAAGRDLVAEYVTACRRHRIRVGFYYSLGDWRFPAYFDGPSKDPRGFARFRRYIHGQVEELCTRYGRIDVLWFDGGWPHDAAAWRAAALDRMIRRHQPHVMINDRLHGGGVGNVKPVGAASKRLCGYFDTAEQRPATDTGLARPIEMCRTTHDTWWGICRHDRLNMTPARAISLLTGAAHRGANLLLNVGPKADGTFPPFFARILKETGRWTGVNGESIYGSAAGILDTRTLGTTTVRGSSLYLHVLYWPGRSATLYGLANRVRSARILGRRGKIRVEQSGLHTVLHDLPARPPDPQCTVIRLDVRGRPREDPSVVHLWEQGRDLESLSAWASRAAR